MRLQEAADQCFVLLNRHASLLLIANSRLSPTGWQHEHDATQRGLAHRAQAYSPKCPEGGFCELRFDGVLGSSASSLLKLQWALGAPVGSVPDRRKRHVRPREQ